VDGWWWVLVVSSFIFDADDVVLTIDVDLLLLVLFNWHKNIRPHGCDTNNVFVCVHRT
jgi:hypothetical protein